MSKKNKSKQSRQPNAWPAKEQPPGIKYQFTITEQLSGDVSVTGFPANINEALNVMLLGIKAITDFFINAALDGKLKHDSKIVKASLGDISKYN